MTPTLAYILVLVFTQPMGTTSTSVWSYPTEEACYDAGQAAVRNQFGHVSYTTGATCVPDK